VLGDLRRGVRAGMGRVGEGGGGRGQVEGSSRVVVVVVCGTRWLLVRGAIVCACVVCEARFLPPPPLPTPTRCLYFIRPFPRGAVLSYVVSSEGVAGRGRGAPVFLCSMRGTRHVVQTAGLIRYQRARCEHTP